MIIINIAGFSPVCEVLEILKDSGIPKGTPIKAYATGMGYWHYIWIGNDVRKPIELENYLFR